MPTYVFRCVVCRNTKEVIRAVADRNNSVVCCGEEAVRVITVPLVSPDYEAFISPIDRTIVRGKVEYEEHCKKHNVRPTSDFESNYSKNRPEPKKVSKDEIAESIQMLEQGYRPQVAKEEEEL